MKKSKKGNGSMSNLAKSTIRRSALKYPIKKPNALRVSKRHAFESERKRKKKPITGAKKPVGKKSPLSKGKRRESFILRSDSFNRAVEKRNQKDLDRFNNSANNVFRPNKSRFVVSGFDV